MSLQVKRIDQSEFDALRPEWNDLLGRSGCDSVFLRWEWIHTWWDIFRRNRELFVLTARRDGRLIGIAPFYIERAGVLRTRTLKVCSEELSPDYMDIIAEAGEKAEVVSEMVKFILQQGGEWDVISFDNLRAESLLVRDHSLFADYAVDKQVSQSCPYVKISGPFEDYYKACPELLTYSLEKKLKKLRDDRKVDYRKVSDEGGLLKGLDALFLLHAKRAMTKRMRSNFLSPDIKRFHHQLSRLFLAEGLLNFQLLYSEDIPVAARYDFTYKNKLFSYQSGFDPDWKKWSVGAVMIYLIMEQAFKEGLHEFDFLKGVESYKNLWSNAVRDEMKLTVYNKTLRGSFWRVMKDLRSALGIVKGTLRSALRP